ncbi:MAG: polymer-forming cytoskeletal protein [Gemmatimonadaceae bacterium]|nr:polymer-forming cytoskeletal protein [Gemmatimonadaceae bacterium]
MSIFQKAPGDRTVARHEGSVPAGEGSVSVVGAGMRIIGDVESVGVIKVEGVIEGGVRSAQQVLLGRSGVIHGDVTVGDAVLGGSVVGTVRAAGRVELQGTASVEGDIQTRSIVVHEGGTINGMVRVGEQGARVVTPSAGHPPVRLAADA